MTLVRVHNPAYAPVADNSSRSTGPGAVLPTLDNARVAVLFNGWPTWQVMLDRFFDDLRARHPSASAKQYLIPRGHAAATELLEEVAAESDCAIVGLGNCGSCTAWSYHDSLELLKTGLPTVWVITREFESLASAMRLSRPAELPTVTLPVNPESVSEADAIALMERTIPRIVGGLVGDDAPAAATVGRATEPRHAEVPEDAAEAFEVMYERGWTDGLPVIAPTETRVERMLAGLEAAPREVLGVLPPRYAAVTAEALAANAVMAGCVPEHMPVLAAMVEAAAVPEFNLNGIATTTASSAPMTIVNGPVRERLGINCGRGMLGPGHRANAALGRALRLAMINLGGTTPGAVSKSVMGQPSRYTFLFGENEEESPWAPLHVDRGLAPDASAVTLMGVLGTTNVMTPRRDWAGICATLGEAFAFMGNNNVLMGRGTIGVIITPGHAKVLSAAGLSKADAQAEIHNHARVPLSRFPASVRPTPPNEWVLDGDDVLVVRDPAQILVVVSGGPEPHYAQILPSHPSVVPTTRELAGA